MSQDQIIRAWKDRDYRSRLSPEQQAQIPDSPVGLVDLADDEMRAAVGGSLLGATGGDAAVPPTYFCNTFEMCYTRWLLCKA